MYQEGKRFLIARWLWQGTCFPRLAQALSGMVRTFLPSLLFATFLMISWELLVATFKIPNWLLPAPTRIAATLVEDYTLLKGHIKTTLWETTLGMSLALAVGLTLSIAIDSSWIVRQTIYPLIIATQTVPVVAVAPLIVVGFGFGLLPKVLVVALVVFFPLVVNTVDGLSQVDRDMLRILQAMRASRWQIFWLLKVPSALPAFFSGLKIAVTYSVIGAVLAEWIGASSGLGVYIARSLRSFRTDRVFVAILVTSCLTLVLFTLTVIIERQVISWNRERKHS